MSIPDHELDEPSEDDRRFCEKHDHAFWYWCIDCEDEQADRALQDRIDRKSVKETP
jgi:hypothetical protein